MPDSLFFHMGRLRRSALLCGDRFAAIAKADTRNSLYELQRQFAYDRTLDRLFTAPDADSWVLKGAGALLARLEQARHSRDIDVYFAEQSAAVSDATAALGTALGREAVSLACALLNPALKGPVCGNWDPVAASWTPPAG